MGHKKDTAPPVVFAGADVLLWEVSFATEGEEA